VAAARALIATLPAGDHPEAWNSAFGPGSLFEAWTRTSIAQSVHGALAEEVRQITAQPGFVLIDVGGGNGSLWRRVFDGSESGTLIVIDTLREAVDAVASAVQTVKWADGAGVSVQRVVAPVQDVLADLPACDGLVCSMTLHHVAGADTADRALHGLSGVGKTEILAGFGEALRGRSGTGFLVEADVDCDLDLGPSDPVLADNIFDSYMRRCGRSILEDVRRAESDGTDDDVLPRWRGLLRYWFLEQLAVVDAPIADRDVYELTVPRWTALFEQAGLQLEDARGVDAHRLFHLYRFRSG
jgi:hypothetical protein